MQKELSLRKKTFSVIKNLLKETYNTSSILFKIMIPVSIIVKILKDTGMIVYISNFFYPLMKFVGLPSEMGLVWATGIISNLYGGLLAYFALSSQFHLTIAQVTVLSTMMLIAHNFSIEIPVARRTGVRIVFMFFTRLISALVLGFILNKIFITFNLFQTNPVLTWHPKNTNDNSLYSWILSELKNYGMIFLMILSLIFVLKILKKTGIINLITKGLQPILKLLGIGKEAIPITIIGLTFGLAYGGALIINESKNNNIPKRDIFYAMVFMGICHSIIEDTIVMLSMGANLSGILVARFLFTLVVVRIIVIITQKLNNNIFNKFFVK
jgi:hypothetical protein